MRIPSFLKRIYSDMLYIKFRIPEIPKKLYSNYYPKNINEWFRNRRKLQEVRNKVKEMSTMMNPLVSVLIPTYNNGEILVKRTIPSVLKQTYRNIEIIIVGDHCTDETEKLIAKFNDKRITFINLPQRGKYPKNPYDRWLVAGSVPANKAIELCSGEWIAPLDDDDEFTPDHIEVLLCSAIKNDYEMVYGKIKKEVSNNRWIDVGSWPLRCGCISRIAVLYNSTLKFIKYNTNSWKCGEPGDWNRWRRMKQAGVKIGFVNAVIGYHYLEKLRINI